MEFDENSIVMGNPSVVLREEFDDWAVLFNPDSNAVLGINPMGVYLWKLMDGKRTVKKILDEMRKDCKNIPVDVFSDLSHFSMI